MKFFIGTLFSLFSVFLYAQSDFSKGYFIDNLNVKTECFIKYTNPRNTPVSFDYRLIDGGKIERKTMKDVSIFEIEKVNKYIRATVNMDRHSRDFSLMDRNPGIILKPETHFLKVLQEGEFNLYIYEENGLERFFYSVSKNPEIIELQYKQYLDNENGQEVKENKIYLRQLFTIIKMDKIQQFEVEKLKYNRTDLEKYFIKVNESYSGAANSTSKKSSLGFVNFKLETTLNNLKLSQVSTSDFSKNFNSGDITAVGFGFELEIVLPFNENCLSVVIEPNFLNNNSSTKNTTFDTFTGIYTEKKVETTLNFFHLPVGLRFSLINNYKYKYRLYFDVSTVILKSLSYNVKIDGTGQTLQSINFSNHYVGIGLIFKKFELQYKLSAVNKEDDTFVVSRNYFALRFNIFSNRKAPEKVN